jgi:ABC-2 type transport system permease protein
MINWTLYKRGIQGSWKMLLIFAAVITMYFTIIISMFDPALGSALERVCKSHAGADGHSGYESGIR